MLSSSKRTMFKLTCWHMLIGGCKEKIETWGRGVRWTMPVYNNGKNIGSGVKPGFECMPYEIYN